MTELESIKEELEWRKAVIADFKALNNKLNNLIFSGGCLAIAVLILAYKVCFLK